LSDLPTTPVTPPVTPPVTEIAPVGEQAVPYARFQEVNTKYNALKAQVATLTDEKGQQTAAQQTLEQRFAELERSLSKERHTNQRLKVASDKKLPSELADRLRGDTEEELASDADRLLAFLKPVSGPGVPPTGGGGSGKPVVDLSKMSAADIRKARAEGKI
jgi:predicted RNase H-like nuclease (RuvC/YqgF family)